jgi:hypothetical protein
METSATRWFRVLGAKAFVILQSTIDILVAQRRKMDRLRLIPTLKLLLGQLRVRIRSQGSRSFIGSSETIDNSISGLIDRSTDSFRCLIDEDTRMME